MAKSHTAENFSRFVIALVFVAVMITGIAWFVSAMDANKCAVGIPCHKGEQQPTTVSY
ncbi:hypothetical protein [Asticcacaulis sp. 201]|uniref:hypothetical protein n=1 Tax=Asticcacaulis sp. 201 TaxID=3028787 RepID=UPI0029165383|nr:hypothetical protein [Asticcacaulis sp. 201]MDV6331808.1 hypothetical protein [Asticcacaulis sp. 201]